MLDLTPSVSGMEPLWAKVRHALMLQNSLPPWSRRYNAWSIVQCSCRDDTFLLVRGVSAHRESSQGLESHNMLCNSLKDLQQTVFQHAGTPVIVRYHLSSHLQTVSAGLSSHALIQYVLITPWGSKFKCSCTSHVNKTSGVRSF